MAGTNFNVTTYATDARHLLGGANFIATLQAGGTPRKEVRDALEVLGDSFQLTRKNADLEMRRCQEAANRLFKTTRPIHENLVQPTSFNPDIETQQRKALQQPDFTTVEGLREWVNIAKAIGLLPSDLRQVNGDTYGAILDAAISNPLPYNVFGIHFLGASLFLGQILATGVNEQKPLVVKGALVALGNLLRISSPTITTGVWNDGIILYDKLVATCAAFDDPTFIDSPTFRGSLAAFTMDHEVQHEINDGQILVNLGFTGVLPQGLVTLIDAGVLAIKGTSPREIMARYSALSDKWAGITGMAPGDIRLTAIPPEYVYSSTHISQTSSTGRYQLVMRAGRAEYVRLPDAEPDATREYPVSISGLGDDSSK